MIEIFIAILLILFLSYCINEIITHVIKVIKRIKLENKEKVIRLEAIASGLQIIDRPEFSDGMKKVIKRAVKAKVKYLDSCYFDCDEVNIWTTHTFTRQLQRMLEKAYKKSIYVEEDCKEFVREIINTCHLEAVRLYPELKEY